jgi:NADPH:quinone reductase-like Zn-dependent oxidoreductase
MRAATVVDRQIVVVERPVPDPGPGEALVRVHGAGLNRADLAQVAGGYPAPPGSPPDIPGLEFAGVVEALGPGATDAGLVAGDAVFGIAGGGAQAEYLTVPAGQCAPAPPGLDLVAMGGVPEAFVTAHDAMVTQAAVQPGEWVAVHAVGSGVGTAAVQLAKAFDAHVVGTARTPSKLDRCRALGLDHGIVPPAGDDGALDPDALAWQIIEATGGGAHVTLDLVGGRYLAADVDAAAPKGRIVLISAMAGSRVTVSGLSIMTKRLRLFGTVLRARDAQEKAAATEAFVTDVVSLLANGTVAPVIETTIPLSEAPRAYELLASNTTFGKVVLDCR